MVEYEKLQFLMDPSRNMKMHRNMLAAARPPLVPFFPVVMKDLTFIHEGNAGTIDDMVNFDKLRMLARACAM